MMPLGFLKLRAIGGQIAALVIVSILVLHLIITAIFLAHRLDDSRHEPWHIHGELSAAVQLLAASAPAERPRLLADIGKPFHNLRSKSYPPPPCRAQQAKARSAANIARIWISLPDIVSSGCRPTVAR